MTSEQKLETALLESHTALKSALSVVTVIVVSNVAGTTEVIGAWLDNPEGNANAETVFTGLLRSYEPHVSDDDIDSSLGNGTVSVNQEQITIMLIHSTGLE